MSVPNGPGPDRRGPRAGHLLLLALFLIVWAGQSPAGAAPSNDNLADAEVITGPSGSVTGSNVGATLETGEISPAGPGGASIWYVWTAPTTDSYTFNTCGTGFDTVLAVYTGPGTSVDTLTPVASNDDTDACPGGSGLESSVAFAATADTTYYIRLDSYDPSNTGPTTLSWGLTPPPPPAPPNDNFVDAQPITGLSGSVTGTNVAATKEYGEPDHAGNPGGASIWYAWTAPANGSYTFDTCASDFDTLLGVYTGPSLDMLTPVASNDDGCPGEGTTPQSMVTFDATAGTTYYIAVDGFLSAECSDCPGGSVAMGTSVLSWQLTGLASPTITTTASSGAAGQPVHDVAVLQGGADPGGTVTFDLFDDAACATTPVFTSTVPVSGASATSADTTLSPGTYHWVATYSGDAMNAAAGPTACDDAAETVVISQAAPTLTTQASTTVAVGQPIFDTATVTGGSDPTGTVTFSLYGPNPASCTGTPIYTSPPTTIVPGTPITSDSFTPTEAGIYRWVASYSGDTDNTPVGPTACDDPAEAVTVTRATTTITTQASPSVPVGGAISDTATIAGGVAPTGTVTFSLFGPDVASCGGTPIATITRDVDGNGAYTSGGVTATQAGTYRWVASYSGDASNEGAGPTACDDPAESVVVGQVAVTLTTSTPATTPIGQPVADTATIAGGLNPTGTVTFQLFGPNDATCSGTPVFTSTRPVAGDGAVASDPFTPTALGTYRWVATYSGDANNASAAGACGDTGEQVAVGQATPTIATVPSPSVTAGQPITDTATLANGFNPTGSITFSLYGPADLTCATPVSSTTKPVTGNGSYVSDPVTPSVSGTYQWVASYSGDANNAPVSGACGDPSESVVVTPAATTTTTSTTIPPTTTTTTLPPTTTTLPPTTTTLPPTTTTTLPPTTTTLPPTSTTLPPTTTTTEPPTTTTTEAPTTSTTLPPTTSTTLPPTTTTTEAPTTTTTLPPTTTTTEPPTTTTTLPPTTTTTEPPTTTTTLPPTTTTTESPTTTITEPTTTITEPTTTTTEPTTTTLPATTTTALPPTTAPPTTAPPTTAAPTTVAPAVTPTTAALTTPTATTTVTPASTVPATTTSVPGPTTTAAPTSSIPPTTAAPTTSTTPSVPPTTLPPPPAGVDAVNADGGRSGPPGVSLHVTGGGYEGCSTVFVFFDGVRIGTDKPDAGGAISASDLFVPGDAATGGDQIVTSCNASGSSPRARTAFTVTGASVHRPAFATSVPMPDQVSLELRRLATSAAVAVAILVLFAFPFRLFNSTVEENYDEIRGWFRLPARAVEAGTKASRSLTFFGLTVIAAIAVGFLSPGFGLNTTSVVTVLGFSAALLVMSVGYSLPASFAIHRQTGEWGRLNFLPGTLLISIVMVALSRLGHWQPGYFYGALAGLAFASALSKREQGRVTAANWAFALVISVAAFFLRAPVADMASKPHASVWWIGVEAALVLIFLWGIESLAVAMLPMRFLDGRVVIDWNRAVWAVLMFLGVFSMVHILLTPSSGYVGHTTGQVTVGVIVLFLIFGAISVGLWAYFRYRPERMNVTRARQP